MTTTRPIAQSLFPEILPDRPIGFVLPSVFVGTNAELLAAVAPLYLDGVVMDCTYGEGKWWDKVRPDRLIAHDIKTDGVSFTELPETTGSIDAVCFDPPYIPQGGYESSTAPDFVARFGLTSRSRTELWDLIGAGLTECARVLHRDGFLLVKCCDFTNGGSFHLGHRRVLDMADELGLRCHDLIIHHTGTGPGGHNIFEPIRARRAHSYLLVFQKTMAGARLWREREGQLPR